MRLKKKKKVNKNVDPCSDDENEVETEIPNCSSMLISFLSIILVKYSNLFYISLDYKDAGALTNHLVI